MPLIDSLVAEAAVTLAILCGAILILLVPATYLLLRPYRARPLEQLLGEPQPRPATASPPSQRPAAFFPSVPAMVHAAPWFQQRPTTLQSPQLPPPASRSPDVLQSVPVLFDPDSAPTFEPPPRSAPPQSAPRSAPLSVPRSAPPPPPQPPARIEARAVIDARELPDFDEKPTTLLDRSVASEPPVEGRVPRVYEEDPDGGDFAFQPTVAADELPPRSRSAARLLSPPLVVGDATEQKSPAFAGEPPSLRSGVPSTPPRVRMASVPPPASTRFPGPLPPAAPPPRRPSAPRIRLVQPGAPRTPPPPKPPSVWGNLDPSTLPPPSSPPRRLAQPAPDPNETAALTPVSAPPASNRPRPRS